MNSSSFLIKPRPILVADASVIINLNATRRAADILRVMQGRLVVTDNACLELERGTQAGYADAEQLNALFEADLASKVVLNAEGTAIYESLIAGATIDTLDDGEAATIGYAVQVQGTALVDERKASRICAAQHPTLALRSTVDLLFDEQVEQALGRKGLMEAVLCALKHARMRVPSEHVAKIKALIGPENAAACSSLPKKP